MFKKYFLDLLLIIVILQPMLSYSFAQACVAVAFITLYGVVKYIESRELNNEAKRELILMKEKVDALMIKNAAKMDKLEGKRFF
ncbi:MAG: hypothetical protein RML94_10210 [Bacteroidia bacterium]|nr:hypothetical protein [Bacteroidia bacterium]